MSHPILEINQVSKNFSGVVALNEVSFTVEPNLIKGLIGPNGAGKTTLFNVITGVYPVSSGEIIFNAKIISGLPEYRIGRAGIARTFQNVKLFGNLTVLANVLVGCYTHMKSGILPASLRLPWTVREEAEYIQKAEELLKYVGLAGHGSMAAGSLPFGQQRLLEIARALATQPKLLLLDEPAAGLSAPERADLAKLIKLIQKDLQITVLLVEHDMDLVMKVCDEIVVLEYGLKIAEGEPSKIQKDRRVIAAYLGEEVS